MSRQLDVFVGVASIPSREASLNKVVERLLPQVRHVGVYLNGYENVPRFLKRGRITVVRSQDHGDVRDNGKFFFLDQSHARYYAAVDDDLLYPSDYVEHLLSVLEGAPHRAAVGVHGAIYPSPVVDLFEPRYLLHFADPLAHVTPMHLLGTGTVLFDQSEWSLGADEFGTPGMADLWFGVAAARREAGLFAVPRIANWLTTNFDRSDPSSGGALFFEGLLHRAEQVALLHQACPPGRTFGDLIRSLLSSPKFADDFSIHQALSLDGVRSQLGYAPLSPTEANETYAVLERQRSVWAQDRVLSGDQVAAVTRLTIDILTNRVSGSSVSPVVDLLDFLSQLAGDDTRRWSTLPVSLRYDSSPERVASLNTALLERGMQLGSEDARGLWTEFEGRVDMTVGLALQAEAASVQTRFERLPALRTLAEENPASAIARLYDYFETVGWAREPDLPALQNMFRSEFNSLEVQMMVCVAAARSGNLGLAKRTLNSLRQRWPSDVDVRLLQASLSISDLGTPGEAITHVFEVLDEVNVPLGFTPFRHLVGPASDAGHWINEMDSSVDVEFPYDPHTPSVTVLMTVHNDERTVMPALRSVLASSGVKLQVLVVDDASSDGTGRLLESVDDSRVTVVRNDVKLGPYLSRNRGLAHASGEFVAIADADDWSHPQRLEYQARLLEQNPHVFACNVAHVRIQPSGLIDLENHLRFVGDGPVTVMFRRWLVDHIGAFDHVRTRGDIEYLRRIVARFGSEALESYAIPLVLATSNPKSNSKRFTERSLNLYRTGARNWHEQRAGTDALYVPLSGGRAPFMAPYELLAVRPTTDGQTVDALEEWAG